MKKETSSSEPKASQASFRRSLSSLLRPTSRSPERTRNVLFGPHNDSKISFPLTPSTTKLSKEPVRAEEFADSDSSQEHTYSDEEARAAESIYSVIQEYEPQRQSFWFNEEFEHSDDSYEDPNTPTKVPRVAALIPGRAPEEGQSRALQNPESGDGSRAELAQNISAESLLNPFKRKRISTGTIGGPAHDLSLPEPDVSPMLEQTPGQSSNYASTQVLDSVEEHDDSGPSRDSRISFSSGELLSRLDASLRLSGQYSNRNSVSSELALQTLIAGVDLNTELPAMVYTVHDKTNPTGRWSVYDKQPRTALAPASRLLQAIPVQIRDGTSRARRVSVLTRSNLTSSKSKSVSMVTADSVSRANSGNNLGKQSRSGAAHANINRSSGSLLGNMLYLLANILHSSGSAQSAMSQPKDKSTPDVFSNLSYVIPENEISEEPSNRAQQNDENLGLTGKGLAQKPIKPSRNKESQPRRYIASPPPSVTKDSIKKGQMHNGMFGEKQNEAKVEAQQEKQLSMPWSKWTFMMIAGLVAIPVFFLLPLGVFDNGGFSRDSDYQMGLDEKATLANWRYQRRYTWVQKLLSLLIGLAWVLVVIAMIAVGFGVGLTR
ncbi:hypothetical protein METSCH_E05150 [Metschnikowia aff. pulcherrima]|uniref:Uncharacterized protein n=1 Tax=Metschnikowia aff. pulcherrima TaxID=2163413 RepID=A0A4P6XS08_9ASCO|nr:hypothetical protein METSCH_E05150 [Metschnikowia aff. pulcherrima]